MEEDLQAIQKATEVASEFVVSYGFQFLGALIIMFIGSKVANWLSSVVLALCKSRELDITLSKFFASITKIVVLVFVGIIALGKFGITITPFIAALGALVFGSTFALQGPIGNYGAGLTIILTRAFVVGNTIRVQGVVGIVREIKLAHTQIVNEDGEVITIPNNSVIGEVLINSFSNLIVEREIGIHYQEDPQAVIAIILTAISQIEDVTTDPKPQVGVDRFEDYSARIGIRYWVPTEIYFETMYATNLEIFNALKRNGIKIATPRQLVELSHEESSQRVI
ncbi:MAG: small conductance mechanosensitive channel [Candidatus Azotimanducaceae bacterium]|jgi:small conductance mechanosensitive channel